MKFDPAQLLPPDAAKAAIAGVAGGIVFWLTNKKSPRDGAISVVVGCICAVYLGPIAAPILEPLIGALSDEADAVSLGGFIVGLSGISISGLILDFIHARRKDF